MSIKGAGVSFSLEVEVHPAIINRAANEIRICLLFFITIIFEKPNLNNDEDKVNFFKMTLLNSLKQYITANVGATSSSYPGVA
jgi:hypothetical protein